MKTLLASILVVPIVCGAGEYVYRDGCVTDIKPISAAPVKPSDEKPPTDKMPSYQREGVHIVDAPYMGLKDAEADFEKADADRQGKEAAGIK